MTQLALIPVIMTYCIVLYYNTGVGPLFPTRKLEERTHPERQGRSKRQAAQPHTLPQTSPGKPSNSPCNAY